MHDAIFRTYDIRGTIGPEFVIENIYLLGYAIASYFLGSRIGVKTVVLGWDDTADAALIAQELTYAFTSSGLNVIHVGVCPTPVMYFSLHVLPVEAGVMITASRSSPAAVSIKLCLGKQPVWGQGIEHIKQLYYQHSKYTALYAGTVSVYPMVKRYIQWLARQFVHLKHKTPSGVINCSGSTASLVFPALTKLLKWTSTLGLDATRASWGITFDADADRLQAYVYGTAVDSDKLCALFMRTLLQQLPHSTVLCDTQFSPLLTTLVRQWGGMSSVVHAQTTCIQQALQDKQARFAGKATGHFFFNDHYFGYSDGIYAGLRLCELTIVEQKTLAELLQQIPLSSSTSEVSIVCSHEIQEKILQDTYQFFAARSDTQLCTYDGIRAITPYGWAQVKKSSTEPAVSLRFEAFTHEQLEQLRQEVYSIVEHCIDAENLTPMRCE